MTSRCLVAIALAACGGSRPATDPRPTLEASADAAVDANPEVVAIAEHAGALGAKPSVPQELRGVPLYVPDVVGLALFRDEQALAAGMLATWARRAGFTVEDPARTRLIFERAARGEHATTGASCGAPLDSARAAAWWSRELGAESALAARVTCAPACTLAVAIGSTHFTAPYDAARPWRTELPHAIAQLASGDAAGIEPVGSRDEAAVTTPLLALELRDRVAHCGAAEVVVGLDARGEVTRCDGSPCACGELAHQVVSDARGSRRAIVAFPASHRVVTTQRGLQITAQLDADPSAPDWIVDPPLRAIEQCFTRDAEPKTYVLSVAGEFDAAGTAVRFELTGAKLEPAVATCVEKALAQMRMPCPSVAKPVARAVLSLSFAKP